MFRYHARMMSKCNAHALKWLAGHSTVPAQQRAALAGLAPALLDALPAGAPWLLGLGGPPGTGKSTLAGMLVACDSKFTQSSPASPEPAIIILSLDDYYLSRTARLALAQQVHPALAQRGVPGTHDLNRLFEDIDRLLAGHTGPLNLPVFNKAIDDQTPQGRDIVVDGRPARVILEGWLVGIPPLAQATAGDSLQDEASEHLRRHMATQLNTFHQGLMDRACALWMLTAPDFATVREWRWQQEQDLPQRMLQSPAEVERFLQPFEVFIDHQLKHAGESADLVIKLDRDHHPHLQCAP